jgi:hypothetical protein
VSEEAVRLGRPWNFGEPVVADAEVAGQLPEDGQISLL